MVQGVEPGFGSGVGVGGDQGDGAEGIDVADFVDVDGPVDAAAPFRVVADDIGDLQAGGVERLRRGIEHDGIVAAGGADGGKGRKAVARHDEFAMDLVADDGDAVTQADVVHPGQFVGRPDAAGGVVGVAQEEERGLFLGATGFEGIPVHMVGGLFIQERTFKDLAAVVADAREEAIVHGRKDDDLFAGHRQGLYRAREGRYDPGGIEDILPVDQPAVAAGKPRKNGFVVVRPHLGIAKDAVCGPRLDGTAHGRCRREIHIGHPQRDEIGGRPLAERFIPLVAAASATLHRRIKIKARIKRGFAVGILFHSRIFRCNGRI